MRGKKIAAALLCAALVSGMTTMTAMAVTENRIASVSLVVESDAEVGGSITDTEVEITTKSDRYTVGDYEFLNDGFSWSLEDVPEVKVYLFAEEGYRFTATRDKVTLKGATVTNVSREDSSHTLVVTMKLPPMSEQVSAVEEVVWTSLTEGKWSSSSGAGTYEVKLYRDGKSVGTTKITSATTYDFSDAMTRAGTYYFRVRPVNKVKEDVKGDWVESGSREIDSETAASIYQNRKPAGEWKQDNTGWWYRNADGSYTVSNWQEINGTWYFFNETGYMATGWVDWNGKKYYCDTTSGAMLADTVTPDGHTVGADGAMIQ